jgi:hypothetical protein
MANYSFEFQALAVLVLRLRVFILNNCSFFAQMLVPDK